MYPYCPAPTHATNDVPIYENTKKSLIQADVPIYENTKKCLIQSAHCLSVNALVAACAEQEGFKNLEKNSVYIRHKDDYIFISKAQLVLL
jgi:hypothetical protein